MGTHPIFESDFDCLTENQRNRYKMNEFFDRAQPQMDKLFSMSHLKADPRHHMKKVYSALTLTLLGATAGAMLANMMPLLANPLIVLGHSSQCHYHSNCDHFNCFNLLMFFIGQSH